MFSNSVLKYFRSQYFSIQYFSIQYSATNGKSPLLFFCPLVTVILCCCVVLYVFCSPVFNLFSTLLPLHLKKQIKRRKSRYSGGNSYFKGLLTYYLLTYLLISLLTYLLTSGVDTGFSKGGEVVRKSELKRPSELKICLTPTPTLNPPLNLKGARTVVQDIVMQKS